MPSRIVVWTVIGALALLAYTATSIVDLAVDYLWFGNVGFRQVFLTTTWTKLLVAGTGIVLAFVILYLSLTLAVRNVGGLGRILGPDVANTPLGAAIRAAPVRLPIAIVAAVLALMSGGAMAVGWESVLLYLNAEDFGAVDPIFERDVGFYVFSLPFYSLIQSYLSSTLFLALLGGVFVYYLYFQAERMRGQLDEMTLLMQTPRAQLVHVAVLGAALLLVSAAGRYLDRFELMHQPGGLFTGPGYADIYGTLPLYTLQALLTAAAAVVLVFGVLRSRWRLVGGFAAVTGAVWVLGGFYPAALQRFAVSPNELERERPYLGHHIDATNRAFALDRVVERRLGEEETLTMADIEANRATVNNVRLWDHEPLLDTFGQIQEIRTYYDFLSVDNDRYVIDGELRQTMLSPRELNNEALPSRTWVNERLTFTHGYGITAGPVNRVNEQGLPVLYVQDLPPKSTAPELSVERPEIYFGEVVRDYVFVKTLQQEFNYPEGDKNIFSTYEGTGGLGLGSLWRRLLLSAYTRDFTMLLSDDFTDETRILLHRNLWERVHKVAPFLHYDRDPYMVVDSGRLYWIFDAYTLSSGFPYAERVGDSTNYMRNPIKVVIDAYDGSLAFYLVEPEEPIARAWAAAFPDFVQPLEAMPASLRAHLRHPAGFFTVQTEMYATYHMHDVNTFYNKEDQWSVPAVDDVRMEPYYTVMRLPGEAEAEFILMLPFTPRLKDNLAAWMVARNDGDQLGQLVVYAFPKQRLIYGPKQMVGRINQDPIVSQQITLWDRAGSNVIRGTLLVIPIEQSLVYIQPLYLRAEDGRIPELKRVIVGYGNDIAMGVDLDDALELIFGDSVRTRVETGPLPSAVSTAAAPAADVDSGSPGARAQRHYDALRDAAAAGDWARFGSELDKLGEALREIAP